MVTEEFERNGDRAEQESQQHQRISLVAYELWVREGRPEGRDKEHWFEAKRQMGDAQDPQAEGPSRSEPDGAGPVKSPPSD